MAKNIIKTNEQRDYVQYFLIYLVAFIIIVSLVALEDKQIQKGEEVGQYSPPSTYWTSFKNQWQIMTTAGTLLAIHFLAKRSAKNNNQKFNNLPKE